jgi:hypothetical protein
MSDNIFLNKIWNPEKGEFESLSQNLLSKYINTYMEGRSNIQTGGMAAAAVPPLTTFDLYVTGNSKYLKEKQNAKLRNEVRDAISNFIGSIQGDDVSFFSFLEKMRAFHYMTNIPIKSYDRVNFASCLARVIRENDYQETLGLPSYMDKYVKVFSGGREAVSFEGSSYILDTSPAQGEDTSKYNVEQLSLYGGRLETISKMGNKSGQIEHAFVSNSIRILLTLLNKAQFKEIRDVQKILLWRENGTLNGNRNNNYVPIEIFYLILKIVAASPSGTRNRTTVLFDKANEELTTAMEQYTRTKNVGTIFIGYNFNGYGQGRGRGQGGRGRGQGGRGGRGQGGRGGRGQGGRGGRGQGGEIYDNHLWDDTHKFTKIQTVIPNWLFTDNSDRTELKNFGKTLGNALPCRQLIALTNIVMRYYKLFKILTTTTDQLGVSFLQKVEHEFSSMSSVTIRADIEKSSFFSRQHARFYLYDYVRTREMPEIIPDYFNKVGDSSQGPDKPPEIYEGILIWKAFDNLLRPSLLNGNPFYNELLQDNTGALDIFEQQYTDLRLHENGTKEEIMYHVFEMLKNDELIGKSAKNIGQRPVINSIITYLNAPEEIRSNVAIIYILAIACFKSIRFQIQCKYGTRSKKKLGVKKIKKEVLTPTYSLISEIVGKKIEKSQILEYFKVGANYKVYYGEGGYENLVKLCEKAGAPFPHGDPHGDPRTESRKPPQPPTTTTTEQQDLFGSNFKEEAANKSRLLTSYIHQGGSSTQTNTIVGTMPPPSSYPRRRSRSRSRSGSRSSNFTGRGYPSGGRRGGRRSRSADASEAARRARTLQGIAGDQCSGHDNCGGELKCIKDPPTAKFGMCGSETPTQVVSAAVIESKIEGDHSVLAAGAPGGGEKIDEQTFSDEDMELLQNIESFRIKNQILTDDLLINSSDSSVENSIITINELKEAATARQALANTGAFITLHGATQVEAEGGADALMREDKYNAQMKEEIYKKHHSYYYNLLDSITTIYNYRKFAKDCNEGTIDKYFNTDDQLFNNLFRYIHIGDMISRIEIIEMTIKELKEYLEEIKDAQAEGRGGGEAHAGAQAGAQAVQNIPERMDINLRNTLQTHSDKCIIISNSIINDNIANELKACNLYQIFHGGSQKRPRIEVEQANQSRPTTDGHDATAKFEEQISEAESKLSYAKKYMSDHKNNQTTNPDILTSELQHISTLIKDTIQILSKSTRGQSPKPQKRERASDRPRAVKMAKDSTRKGSRAVSWQSPNES